MPRYKEEQALVDVATGLMDKFHPHLKILRIGFLFREEASISDGKVIVGMAMRNDDRNWTLSKKGSSKGQGIDAIIEVAKDVWEDAEPRFREALIDHELSHIGLIEDKETGTLVMDEITGRIKIKVRPHDIEEFEGVLTRHGAYHEALRTFLRAFAQHKEDQRRAKKAGCTGGMSDDDSAAT